jgi:hypothetical protein
MNKVFVIKESTSNSFPFLWMALFLSIFFSIYLRITYGILFVPIIVLLSFGVLIDTIRYCISVFVGFALKMDLEKREIILNHSLLFYKKTINFDDVLEIQVERKNRYLKEKAYLMISKSVHLTKLQKFFSKENETSYKIPLTTISVDYIELLKAVFEFHQNSN